MNFTSPFMMWALLVTGLGGAYLFLHTDAETKQKLDATHAVVHRESAKIDRNIAIFNDDKEGLTDANKQLELADKEILAANKKKIDNAKNDQREAVRDSLDDMLKPKNQDK